MEEDLAKGAEWWSGLIERRLTASHTFSHYSQLMLSLLFGNGGPHRKSLPSLPLAEMEQINDRRAQRRDVERDRKPGVMGRGVIAMRYGSRFGFKAGEKEIRDGGGRGQNNELAMMMVRYQLNIWMEWNG